MSDSDLYQELHAAALQQPDSAAVAEYAANLCDGAVIICAGTQGQTISYSAEDALDCASDTVRLEFRKACTDPDQTRRGQRALNAFWLACVELATDLVGTVQLVRFASAGAIADDERQAA